MTDTYIDIIRRTPRSYKRLQLPEFELVVSSESQEKKTICLNEYYVDERLPLSHALYGFDKDTDRPYVFELKPGYVPDDTFEWGGALSDHTDKLKVEALHGRCHVSDLKGFVTDEHGFKYETIRRVMVDFVTDRIYVHYGFFFSPYRPTWYLHYMSMSQSFANHLNRLRATLVGQFGPSGFIETDKTGAMCADPAQAIRDLSCVSGPMTFFDRAWQMFLVTGDI